MFVALGGEDGEELFDVLAAAGLHGDVDDGVAEVDTVVGAVVEGVDDVGAVVGDEAGEFGEGPGLVEEMDAEADESTVLDEAALDDAAEEGDVDVAAADEDGGVRAGRDVVVLFWRSAASAVAPAPSAKVFFAFEQDEDGGGDLVFVHGDDLVDVVLDHGEGDVSGAANADAVGDGGAAPMVTG